MTRCYMSGEIRARSTIGIANVVELFNRNEPRFGLSLGFQPQSLRGQRDESGSMKTLILSGRISER